MRKNTYGIKEQRYILGLMKKFELCFELENVPDTLMVPDLLNVNEPDEDKLTIDGNQVPTLEIHYYFLPRSIMPRFMVKMHKDLENPLFWRTGMVVYSELYHTRAMIKADNDDRLIKIWMDGSQPREYLAVIMHAFREINNSFSKIEAIEKIPMPDAPEISVSYQHLVRIAQRGEETYWPDGASKEYSVQELLGSVQHQNQTQMDKAVELLEQLLEQSKSDDETSLLNKADKIIIANPSLFGFGINIKELLKAVYGKRRA